MAFQAEGTAKMCSTKTSINSGVLLASTNNSNTCALSTTLATKKKVKKKTRKKKMLDKNSWIKKSTSMICLQFIKALVKKYLWSRKVSSYRRQ